jgi:butyrate kinase
MRQKTVINQIITRLERIEKQLGASDEMNALTDLVNRALSGEDITDYISPYGEFPSCDGIRGLFSKAHISDEELRKRIEEGRGKFHLESDSEADV